MKSEGEKMKKLFFILCMHCVQESLSKEITTRSPFDIGFCKQSLYLCHNKESLIRKKSTDK